MSELHAAIHVVCAWTFGIPVRSDPHAMTKSVLLAALLISFGTSAASPSELPGNPFGGSTITASVDPLVKIWSTLLQRIRLDDLIISSCLNDETTDCTAARKLMNVVNEARQYHGKAMLGHINRSINLMIKPSAGFWTSALDIFKIGSGDCKDYSIAKYAALHMAGISSSNIRLLIVHDNTRKQNHMVVSVYDNGQWLLLDNLTMTLVTDTDRRGYVPIYVLDDTGVRRYDLKRDTG